MPRTSLNTSTDKIGALHRVLIRTTDGALLSEENYGPFNGGTHSRLRVTVNTPGYRTKRVEDLPMNPFTYVESNKKLVSGVAEQEFTQHDQLQVDVGNGTYFFTYDTTELTDSLKNSVNAQVSNNILRDLKAMKINLGVVFGERKRTGDLLLKTASRIAGAYRALRNFDPNGVMKALGMSYNKKFVNSVMTARGRRTYVDNVQVGPGLSRALADEWLSIQYGWKPLLSDVYNAAEELARFSQEPRKFRISTSRTVRWNKSNKPSTWYQVPYTRTDVGRYTRKIVMRFSYSNEVLHDLSRLGVTNPASIAWELTPLSFVLDWFIPIGNYIDLWDATLGVTFDKGAYTSFEKWSVTGQANGTVYKNSGLHRHTVRASGWHDYVSCVREPMFSFPLPQLPSFSPRLSFNKGVTTLALLRQRLKQ